MPRVNFSSATKRNISERAGLQCSYPACSRRTLSPGVENDELSNSGVAAHIYSASANGPRGQGALSDDELRDPANAIWLCREHGTLVDNNRGVRFPPQLLLSYKQMHEARVAHEHQGLYSPVGWLHKVKIAESQVFTNGSTFTLAKLNLIIGNNGTGKSALCEWLAGFFDISYLVRWREVESPLKVELTYIAPQEMNLRFEIPRIGEVRYQIDGISVPLSPLCINVICPDKSGRYLNDRENSDDLHMFSRVLRVDPAIVENLIEIIHSYRHANIRNIRFQVEHGLRKMYLDVDGTHPGLPFRALSGTEQEAVFIEFLSALARSCGRYAPTILLLDGFLSIFFRGWFNRYSNHFLSPDNEFQTILTIPTRDIDLENVRWNGWQVLHTAGRQPACVITQ